MLENCFMRIMSQSKRICFWVPLVHGRCRCGNCYQTRWCWSSKLQQFANSKPWPIEWSLSHSEAISDMIFSSYSHDVPMIFQKFSVILGLQLIDIPMIDMSILGFHTSDTGWWFTYPSEKWWSSSVGMDGNSQLNGKIKHVPNHQPDHHHIPIVVVL